MVESKKREWIVTENHHEPIVSKEIFDKAQNILDKRKGYFDNKDVFAGYVKCADCGSTMITRKSKDKEYYYCSNYTRNKKCTSHSINKNKFNRLVTEDCKINLKNTEKTNLDKYISNLIFMY